MPRALNKANTGFTKRGKCNETYNVESLAGARFFPLNKIIRLKNTSVRDRLDGLGDLRGDPQALKTDRDGDIPVFRAEVWGNNATDFSTRVRSVFRTSQRARERTAASDSKQTTRQRSGGRYGIWQNKESVRRERRPNKGTSSHLR